MKGKILISNNFLQSLKPLRFKGLFDIIYTNNILFLNRKKDQTMVKKVNFDGNFICAYQKDIKNASNLLNRFKDDKSLKKSMVHALLSCLSEAAEMHEDVSYDYNDNCGGDYLAHYLFEIENKFSETKRPLVWLCGYLSYNLISYNSNNIRAVIISEDVMSSDLSDLIGPENYENLFVDSSVSENEFLNKIIELSECQLKDGWGFSECLGQSIERNICINNAEKMFFCTDYDLSWEKPGYIKKGEQYCFSVYELIKNIDIHQYVKFKNNSPLSQNALFYGKIVRMFASGLLEDNVNLDSDKSGEFYKYAKERALEVVEDDYFVPFVIKSFEDNVQNILTLSHDEILDGEYCDLGMLPVYSDFRNFYIDLDMGYYDD